MFKFKPKVITPTGRFVRFWLLLLIGLASPILAGVPWLMDAVPQAIMVAVGLVALQQAQFTQPIRRGALAMLRGAVVAVIAATALAFILAALYVLRNGTALPTAGGWQQVLVGTVYIAVIHVLAIWVIAKWWPTSTPVPAQLA